MIKFKKGLLLSVLLLLLSGMLTGCGKSIENVVYTKTDSFTITSEDGTENIEIPYSETLTVYKQGDDVIGGKDDITYNLTDKYFESHEDAKSTLLTNLSSGLKSTYVDNNMDAISVTTEIVGDSKDQLHAVVEVNFEDLESLSGSTALFGLTEDDFDDNQRAQFSKLHTIMSDSGFTQSKTGADVQ